MRAAIVDEAGTPVSEGVAGELWMAGPQVAAGYLDDPARTAERFVRPAWDQREAIWYRTGDLARCDEGRIIHLGRMDDQVKIRGYRIELGEVESVLRAVLATEMVAVLATPSSDATPSKLVAFVAHEIGDEVALRSRLAQLLPDYMVPSEVIRVERLPLNANGKVDKSELLSGYGGR